MQGRGDCHDKPWATSFHEGKTTSTKLAPGPRLSLGPHPGHGPEGRHTLLDPRGLLCLSKSHA